MKKLMTAALALSMMTGGAATVYAQDAQTQTRTQQESEVVLQGNITDVSADSFTMDYGSQYIDVDISSLTDSTITSELSDGDRVEVTGSMTDPWLEGQQVVANKVTIMKSTSENVETVDPDTGEEVSGTLTTNETIEYQAAEGSDTITPEPYIVAGTVTNINGRNLMIETDEEAVTIDTLPLYVDPTGAYVFPSIERGDMVEISTIASEDPDAYAQAQKLVSIKKPYEDTVYEGQVLTAKGVRFVMKTQMQAGEPDMDTEVETGIEAKDSMNE